jgi:hypothetical protein
MAGGAPMGNGWVPIGGEEREEGGEEGVTVISSAAEG